MFIFNFHFQHKMFGVTINQQHQLAQHQQLVKLLEMRCSSGGLTHCTLPSVVILPYDERVPENNVDGRHTYIHKLPLNNKQTTCMWSLVCAEKKKGHPIRLLSRRPWVKLGRWGYSLDGWGDQGPAFRFHSTLDTLFVTID